MHIELMVLKYLIKNKEYMSRTIPFIDEKYFSNVSERLIFNHIKNFVIEYKSPPTPEAIVIELQDRSDLKENQFNDACSILGDIQDDTEEPKLEWLIRETEKFCQDRALYNAIMDSIKIIDDKNGHIDRGQIPDLLTSALGVSFDEDIGHDYLDDAEDRYEYYHRDERHHAFDIDFFNRITKGGLTDKTLNIILAGTNVGKSLIMCHMAAAFMSSGKNVLYITMEMSEERIAERIDANLLDTNLDDLTELPREVYDRKIDRVRKMTTGKLKIKEYPTGCANVNHFRHLIDELHLKKKFVPDIVIVDYMNICSSARLKNGAKGMYEYVKAIAEELRGLAVEKEFPIITATQTNREGYSDSDVDLTGTSESFATNSTADLIFAAIRSEELDRLNQIMIKQLKNRYSDVTVNRRFVVGVERAKMKLYDVEQSAQAGLSQANIKDDDDGPSRPLPDGDRRRPPKDKFAGITI